MDQTHILVNRQKEVKKPKRKSSKLNKISSALSHLSPQNRLILLLITLIIILVVVINYLGGSEKYKQPSQTQQTPTPTQALEDNLSNWKTYRNSDLHFQISYPNNYYLSSKKVDEETIVKISSSPHFEENELSLVIAIESFSNKNFKPSSDPRILNILNDFGFQEINEKFSNYLSGNFLGDPPWGYYQIVIPSMDPNKTSVLTTTRIHQTDEVSVPEGGTEGKLANSANQILSTFKFLEEETRDVSTQCKEIGGRWLHDYNECENINKEDCNELGGIYSECSSACRHDFGVEMCVQSCVEVCKFMF